MGTSASLLACLFSHALDQNLYVDFGNRIALAWQFMPEGMHAGKQSCIAHVMQACMKGFFGASIMQKRRGSSSLHA
jgi:hypothetical protein